MAESSEAAVGGSAQEQAAHDADCRAKGFPWCDTCQHAAVFSEGQGFLHSTPEHPFGHPRRSDPFADHEVTMRRWNRAIDGT